MDSLFGLPAHPLLVHGAVVLVPLTALGAVVTAVSVPMRRRIGVIVVGLALVAFVFTFLAKESGESLEEKVDEDELVEDHAELGDITPVFAFALLAVSGGLVGVDILGRRMAAGSTAVTTGDDPAASPPPWLGPVAVGLAVITVVVSVAATYQMALVGHSGAKATWQEVQDGGERDGAVGGVDGEEREDDD